MTYVELSTAYLSQFSSIFQFFWLTAKENNLQSLNIVTGCLSVVVDIRVSVNMKCCTSWLFFIVLK